MFYSHGPVIRPLYPQPCQIKGSSIAARLRWLRLHHGEGGVDALSAKASPGLVEILAHGAKLASWYPIEHFVELCQAIDRHFGDGDLAMVKELGRYAAEANLTTVFRLFFRVGTVNWTLSRASRLWRMHYNTGQLLVREFPDTEVELEIRDFAIPSRVHCLSVQGWAERAAELTGAREVVLREVDCRARGDERCRFRVDWA